MTDDVSYKKLKKETERKEKISWKKKQAKGEDKVEEHKKGRNEPQITTKTYCKRN